MNMGEEYSFLPERGRDINYLFKTCDFTSSIDLHSLDNNINL